MPVFSTPRILRPGLALATMVLAPSGPPVGAAVKPFLAHELVLVERISDPQLPLRRVRCTSHPDCAAY